MLKDEIPAPVISDHNTPKAEAPNERPPSGNDFEARYHKPGGERLEYPIEGIPEFGETIEVAEGILWLRMPLPFSLEAINLYLLDDGDGWTILDSGLNTSMVRGMWDGVFERELADKPVNQIVVTHYHPDHVGLAGWLAEKTGAPLVMSQAEIMLAKALLFDRRDEVPEAVLAFYKAAGFPDEALAQFAERGYGHYATAVWELPVGYRRMSEGDEIKAGGRTWRIVEGSGHSPEHACLFCEDEKILISGDQLLPKITSNVSVYPTEPEADPLANWFDSLAKLETLPEGTFVLPSHNEPFIGVHQRCEDIRAAHIRRLVSLTELCVEAPRCAVEAFPALFRRKLSGMDFIMAAGEALAHLKYLEVRGILERESEAGVDRFKTIAAFDPDSVEAEFSRQPGGE